MLQQAIARSRLPKVTVLALACAILAACGGGDGGTTVTPNDHVESVGNSGTSPAAAHAATAPASATTPSKTAAAPASTPALASGNTVVAAPAKVVAKPGDTVAPVLYYVSPTGNDNWSGTLPAANPAATDGPFKTLGRAQIVARAALAGMKAGTQPRASVKVEIQPGTYAMTAPMRFLETDSGIDGYPMVYEAVTPGTVVISGGQTLKQASSDATKIVYTAPTGVDWTAAQQLYVSGKRADLARQPNVGTNWFVTKAITLPGEVAPNVGVSAFDSSDDAVAFINGLSSDDRARAVLDLYQSWTTGRHRLATAPAGAIQVTPAAKWPALSVGTSQRFFVENVKAALDAPGEWFGNSTGVTYLRRAGETAPTMPAVMPMLDNIINIRANAAANLWVEYLELRGLRIENSRFLTAAGGYTDFQAASGVDAALDVDSARYITIDNCRFSHIGGYGLWLRSNVRGATVSNNTLSDLGAGGIKVGLESQSPSAPNPTGANNVTGNTVTDNGHILPGAVGIWVGQTFDNKVTHNIVANTTYTGISVGWQWGYGTATAGNNTIANNLLYNIGLGTLSDLGGIYTVGVQPGTSVTSNLIREVRGYTGYGPMRSSGAWGIYQDQGVSQTSTANNVVIGTDNGGFHENYGRNNSVTNNIFARGGTAEFRLSVSDPLNTQLATSSNLMLPLSLTPFDMYASAPDVLYQANTVSPVGTGGTPDLSKCGGGCSTDLSTVATTAYPLQVTLTQAPAAFNTLLTQTLGSAGFASSPLLKQPGVATTIPVPVLAPPVPFSLDIAGTAIGAIPVGLRAVTGNDPTSVRTVAKAGAAGGGKCVQFTDSSTFVNKYEPYAASMVNYSDGTATATFQLWVDSSTWFQQEWRDAAVPYNVGPSLSITSAGISVNYRTVMPLAMNSWNTFVVTAPLGGNAGTWSLKVIDSTGASRTVTGLQNGSAAFKALQSVFFISDANVSTVACLGSLQIANQ